jgi:DNA-binding PadR family transcriptional regulator
MRKPNLEPESQLPLSPAVFNILLALADEDRHGYGIMQEVKHRTEGKIHLGSGTLYGAIKRLLAKYLIEEVDERQDSELNEEQRRYYRLTNFGQRVLQAEVKRLDEMVRQARAKQMFPGFESSQEMGST